MRSFYFQNSFETRGFDVNDFGLADGEALVNASTWVIGDLDSERGAKLVKEALRAQMVSANYCPFFESGDVANAFRLFSRTHLLSA